MLHTLTAVIKYQKEYTGKSISKKLYKGMPIKRNEEEAWNVEAEKQFISNIQATGADYAMLSSE